MIAEQKIILGYLIIAVVVAIIYVIAAKNKE